MNDYWFAVLLVLALFALAFALAGLSMWIWPVRS